VGGIVSSAVAMPSFSIAQVARSRILNIAIAAASGGILKLGEAPSITIGGVIVAKDRSGRAQTRHHKLGS